MGEEIAFNLMRIAGLYLNTYSILILVLIIVYLFVKQSWKNECINWIYVCNSIVPWVTFVNLLSLAAELFIAWYGQNTYEYFVFSQDKVNAFSPYGWSYWLMLCLNFLIPLLLWFKRLRKSIVFTIFMILILNAGRWYERLVIWITSYYRDYLPSSWSTYTERNYLLDFLLGLLYFFLLSGTVYWFFHKRKKLPFPSVILSYSLLA
jgi:hypothetical protein